VDDQDGRMCPSGLLPGGDIYVLADIILPEGYPVCPAVNKGLNQLRPQSHLRRNKTPLGSTALRKSYKP